MNAFAVTINFIWHIFEYSLMYFFNSECYLSEYRSFIVVYNSLFLTFNIIKNFVALLQTSHTLFHCVLLEIYGHPSLFAS